MGIGTGTSPAGPTPGAPHRAESKPSAAPRSRTSPRRQASRWAYRSEGVRAEPGLRRSYPRSGPNCRGSLFSAAREARAGPFQSGATLGNGVHHGWRLTDLLRSAHVRPSSDGPETAGPRARCGHSSRASAAPSKAETGKAPSRSSGARSAPCARPPARAPSGRRPPAGVSPVSPDPYIAPAANSGDVPCVLAFSGRRKRKNARNVPAPTTPTSQSPAARGQFRRAANPGPSGLRRPRGSRGDRRPAVAGCSAAPGTRAS